jgi:hypothetical protein
VYGVLVWLKVVGPALLKVMLRDGTLLGEQWQLAYFAKLLQLTPNVFDTYESIR